MCMYARAHTHKTMQGPMCACDFVSHSYAHALACTVHLPYYTHNINKRALYMYSCRLVHAHTHIYTIWITGFKLGNTVDNKLSIVFSLI